MAKKLGRRQFITAAAGAAASAALASCTPAATTPAAAPAAGATTQPAVAKGPVKLTMWSGYPEMDPFYRKAADDFTKANPNVTIEITSYPLRDYEQKLAATLSSDTAADVIEATAMTRYIEAGLIPELPAKVKEFAKAPGRFDAELLRDLTAGDKIYGLLIRQTQKALFYNTKMFKEAGLSGPPKTFEEMMEQSKKLTKLDAAGNVVRSGHSLRLFGAGSGVAEKFWFVLWPAGGDLLEQVGDKWRAGYNNDGGRAAVKYYIDMVHKYKCDDLKLKHDTEAFQLEQTAMFFRESNVIGDTKKKAPNLEYDTAPIPKWNRWGTLKLANQIYVTRSCKNPDAAWDYALFMQQPEYVNFMISAVGWTPARQDVDYSAAMKDAPQFKGFLFKDPEYKSYLTPRVAQFDEIETKFAERLVTAFADASLVDNPTGIAKAIADAAAETNEILRKANVLAA